MTLKEILCQNIIKRRKKLGLTQAALAERLQITPEAMTRMEKGQITPKLSRLEALARSLQCSVPALFRPYAEQNDRMDKASIIIDSLIGLPEEAQDAIVDLVLHASRVMGDKRKE